MDKLKVGIVWDRGSSGVPGSRFVAEVEVAAFCGINPAALAEHFDHGVDNAFLDNEVRP